MKPRSYLKIPFSAMSAVGFNHEISTIECISCSCNLPFKLFSKSQIKKVQAGKPGRCEPCTAGIPGPSLPTTPIARPEDGYCLTSEYPQLENQLTIPSKLYVALVRRSASAVGEPGCRGNQAPRGEIMVATKLYSWDPLDSLCCQGTGPRGC